MFSNPVQSFLNGMEVGEGFADGADVGGGSGVEKPIVFGDIPIGSRHVRHMSRIVPRDERGQRLDFGFNLCVAPTSCVVPRTCRGESDHS